MNSKREKGKNVESRRQISGVRRVEAYYRVREKGMAYRDKEREKRCLERQSEREKKSCNM